jgi:hypothetical protein
MRLLVILCMAAQLCGCAATATVMTKRGSLEATVNGGDAESLVVTNEVGLERRVPREEIVDIDHPGNVLATVFGVSAAVLGLDVGVLAASGTCSGPVIGRGLGIGPCVAAGSLAALSVGFFALGLWQWVTSRNAVMNPLPASDGDIATIPFAFPPGEQPPPELVPVPGPPPLPPPGL